MGRWKYQHGFLGQREFWQQKYFKFVHSFKLFSSSAWQESCKSKLWYWSHLIRHVNKKTTSIHQWCDYDDSHQFQRQTCISHLSDLYLWFPKGYGFKNVTNCILLQEMCKCDSCFRYIRKQPSMQFLFLESPKLEGVRCRVLWFSFLGVQMVDEADFLHWSLHWLKLLL